MKIVVVVVKKTRALGQKMRLVSKEILRINQSENIMMNE